MRELNDSETLLTNLTFKRNEGFYIYKKKAGALECDNLSQFALVCPILFRMCFYIYFLAKVHQEAVKGTFAWFQ